MDPDPHQNVTDPQHWISVTAFFYFSKIWTMLENTVKRVPTITITVTVTVTGNGTVINYGSGSAKAKSYGSYGSATVTGTLYFTFGRSGRCWRTL